MANTKGQTETHKEQLERTRRCFCCDHSSQNNRFWKRRDVCLWLKESCITNRPFECHLKQALLHIRKTLFPVFSASYSGLLETGNEVEAQDRRFPMNRLQLIQSRCRSGKHFHVTQIYSPRSPRPSTVKGPAGRKEQPRQRCVSSRRFCPIRSAPAVRCFPGVANAPRGGERCDTWTLATLGDLRPQRCRERPGDERSTDLR